jgi:cephalosporin hydroxylase/nucleoside-diphosphate-sugar epimerase
VKRVLVTGASGFVGRTALQPLVERGFDVHAVSRDPHRDPSAVTWHVADLLDEAELDAVVAQAGATHLLHFAWYAEHGRFWDAPENADWVRASVRLARVFAAAGGRRVVAAGTCAEYDWTGGLEATPAARATCYGESKSALRDALETEARQAGFKFAWGRIFFPYGPAEKPDRLIASTARALVAGGAVECRSAARVVDYVYVADVGNAFAALVDSGVEGVFDVGSGCGMQLEAILRRFEKLAGRQGVVRFADPAREEAPVVADIGRLERELGWRPRWTLDTGLKATLEWWRREAAREEAPTPDTLPAVRGAERDGHDAGGERAAGGLILRIDLERAFVEAQDGDGVRSYALDTPEAFALVSQAWLRAGWDTKYVYGFTWFGRPVIQLPEDLIRVQEVIYRIRPAVIVETGIAHGGSLVFYASLCKAMGHGRVIGVDIEIRPHNRKALEEHPLIDLITLHEGDSTDERIVAAISADIGDSAPVLVLLDSKHTKEHVRRELELYAPLVSVGSYIVAADGIMADVDGAPRTEPDWAWNNPREAVKEFVAARPDFVVEVPEREFNEGSVREPVTYWPGGWIRRVS